MVRTADGGTTGKRVDRERRIAEIERALGMEPREQIVQEIEMPRIAIRVWPAGQRAVFLASFCRAKLATRNK
jgi:hypothetical protein